MKHPFLLLLLIFLLACQNQMDCRYKPPVDKNDGLQVSTLQAHHFKQSVFDEYNKEICDGLYGNIHCLLVVHNNQLVIEQYYNGWEADRLHFIASVTKSINPLLIGMAIEQGKIGSVNEKMLSYFPEYASLEKDPLKHEIRIENLLNMTSGFK